MAPCEKYLHPTQSSTGVRECWTWLRWKALGRCSAYVMPRKVSSLLILIMNSYPRAQEVSREFPDVDFVSVDSSPLTPHNARPNVVFEVYDLYNGIAEPDDSFDVVHMRHAVLPVSICT